MQMVMQSIVLAALLAPAAGASGGLRATSAATSGAAGQLTADAPLRGEAHRSAILALVEDMPPKVEGAIQALASESKQIATNPTKAESGASGGSYLTRVVLQLLFGLAYYFFIVSKYPKLKADWAPTKEAIA